jgi:hypothetical protein
MICTFRLCNFIRARFSPKAEWKKLVGSIVRWLCNEEADWSRIPDAYSVGPVSCEHTFDENVRSAAGDGIGWYKNSGVLLDDGAGGVYEGIKSEIEPGGTQEYNKGIRSDSQCDHGSIGYG